jgi:hypothetical protein
MNSPSFRRNCTSWLSRVIFGALYATPVFAQEIGSYYLPYNLQNGQLRRGVTSEGKLPIRSLPGQTYPILTYIPGGAYGIIVTGPCKAPEDQFLSRWPFCPVRWGAYEGWVSSCCISRADPTPPPRLEYNYTLEETIDFIKTKLADSHCEQNLEPTSSIDVKLSRFGDVDLHYIGSCRIGKGRCVTQARFDMRDISENQIKIDGPYLQISCLKGECIRSSMNGRALELGSIRLCTTFAQSLRNAFQHYLRLLRKERAF